MHLGPAHPYSARPQRAFHRRRIAYLGRHYRLVHSPGDVPVSIHNRVRVPARHRAVQRGRGRCAGDRVRLHGGGAGRALRRCGFHSRPCGEDAPLRNHVAGSGGNRVFGTGTLVRPRCPTVPRAETREENPLARCWGAGLHGRGGCVLGSPRGRKHRLARALEVLAKSG